MGDSVRSEWRPSGLVTAIGSLPHRDAGEAARFSLAHGDLPAVPTLPKRSPAESMISQALSGVRGVTVGPYGSMAVDVDAVDLHDPIEADLADDAYGGWRAFFAEAERIGYRGPIKWQFVGPVTLGIALVRAGVASSVAFDVAVAAVRSHVEWLLDVVAERMPTSQQVVFIDEPSFADIDDDFPLAPDAAIDLVSAAMAMVEARAVAGLHCCAHADLAALLATGPNVLSVPVGAFISDQAPRLSRFIERGGIVAWGAVPTSGPLYRGDRAMERAWRTLSNLWCELLRRGLDPVQLRSQAIITPECGLGTHTPDIAEQVMFAAAYVGAQVSDVAHVPLISHGR